MQMWNETNAGAQMEHYKKAGLNPALMYGGSGAGGSTAATAAGNVASGNAESGMGMGMVSVSQNMLTAAQADLMKAQAENLRADTNMKTGVDVEQKYATIENLKANTKNTQAQETLTKVQTEIAGIQQDIASKTSEATIDGIKNNSEKILNELMLLQNQTDISAQTKDTIIQTVKQELINKVIQAKIGDTQIVKMKSDIAQGWENLSYEARKTAVQELTGGQQKDEDQIINLINGIVNMFIVKKLTGNMRAPEVKGFRR